MFTDMFALFMLFCLLAFAGFGLPVAEEASLLLAAWLVVMGASFPFVLAAAVLGMAVADTSRYLQGRVRSRQFQRFTTGRQFLQRSGVFALLVSRFLVSQRAVIPYMAGAMQFGRWRFHAASVIGSLLYAAFVIGIGWSLASALVRVTSVAAILWFACTLIVGGVATMHATQAHVRLMQTKD